MTGAMNGARLCWPRWAQTVCRKLALWRSGRRTASSTANLHRQPQPQGGRHDGNAGRDADLLEQAAGLAAQGARDHRRAANGRRSRRNLGSGDYLSAHAPGDLIHGPGVAEAADAGVAPAHHLAIITAQVQSIDWLELARSGHRRAFIQADSWSWRVP